MAAQRHHVRRQVLELQVSGQAQAGRLYPALSRLQDRQIVPLIDRICSQLSHPSRLDRIDRLELYLGKIDTRDLEEDFLVKLEGQLQRATIKRCVNSRGGEYPSGLT